MKFTKLILIAAVTMIPMSAFAAETKSSEGQSASVACQASTTKNSTEASTVAAAPAEKKTDVKAGAGK